MPDNVAIRRLASREALMRRIRAGDSYSVLLAAIVFAYGMMAVLTTTQWHRTIEGAIFGGVLLLALYTSHMRGRWIQVAAVVIGLWVALNVVQSILDEAFHGSGYAMSSIIVLTPFVVLNRVLRHPRVNLETILGAVCAYMLIGIAFATVYALMDSLGDARFFAQEQTHDPVKFLYFSFIVLTTVGFGDLSPGTNAGRILVSMEALIGQVFLVTFVAGLVGNIGRVRNHDQPAAPAPDPPGHSVDEL
ncbi:MAG: potassium channel family protein [Acidimicrobiia bacterium]